MKVHFTVLLGAIAFSTSAFAEGGPAKGKPVPKYNIKSVLTDYAKSDSTFCYDEAYFEKNESQCADALAAAWRANKKDNSVENYNHYKKLNTAAINAGLTYVFTDGTSGQVNSKKQNGMVYATVDANGKIVKTSADQPNQQNGKGGQGGQQGNNSGGSNGRGYQLTQKEKDDLRLTDDDAEKVANGKYERVGYSAGAQADLDKLSKGHNIDQLNKDATTAKTNLESNQVYKDKQALDTARSKQGLFGRVFKPSQELKDARETMRNNRNDAGKMESYNTLNTANNQSARDKRKADAKIAKEKAAYEAKLKIGEENTTGYCGSYGGAGCDGTRALNQGAAQLQQTVDSSLSRAMGNRNAAVQMKLQSQGMNASQADALKAQAEMAKNGVKQIGNMVTTTQVVAGLQTMRALSHHTSQRNVLEAKAANDKEIQRLRDEGTKIGGVQGAAMLAKADERARYGSTNSQLEIGAQKKAVGEQMMVVAGTMMKMQALAAEKKGAQAAADMLNMNAAAMNQGSNFSFTPNPVGQNPSGNDPNNPNNNPGSVVDTGTGEEGIVADGDVLNPNMGNDGLMPPMPGQPMAGGGDKGGGGAVGGGATGGGGTSAAKDDSKGEGVAPGKAQAGGSYAAGEGGVGSKFSRPGGGGGGADDSWLEMMKKFLPGGDDVAKNNEAPVDLSDRSIASDQPSVLGRNKNIFEEISKKYQIKNSEGAIVFVGDRT